MVDGGNEFKGRQINVAVSSVSGVMLIQMFSKDIEVSHYQWTLVNADVLTLSFSTEVAVV